MLSLWGLQHLDLAYFFEFLWIYLKSIVLKPKQNMSCMLLTSEFINLFILLISAWTYLASVLRAFLSQKWQELYMVEDWLIRLIICEQSLFTLVSPEKMLYKDSCTNCVLWNSSLNLLKKDCCSSSAFVIKLQCSPKAVVHHRKDILPHIFWSLNLFTCDIKMIIFWQLFDHMWRSIINW